VASRSDIRAAVRELDLRGAPLCVHSSLRSFGHMRGGADAILRALLDEDCTVMVPTFTYMCETGRPADRVIERNADWPLDPLSLGGIPTFHPCSHILSRAQMGAIPAAVLAHARHVRGNHPLNSFSAVGPLANELIAEQQPLDVYAPFRALIAHGGHVVMMGVGLTKMTLIHEAERRAGRTLFHAWAKGSDGSFIECEVGSCSGGFDNLIPSLAGVLCEYDVGESHWLVGEADKILAAAVDTIRSEPRITHCGSAHCTRCDSAVAGGPILKDVRR
jgi:aminoglycoside 3-N-acetyltransferase